jgi:YidC/Oxa1 family membrane protein insertase
LRWVNHLDKLEKSPDYEKTLVALNYKPMQSGMDYISSKTDISIAEKTHWVSHTQQFFNTTLVAEEGFVDMKSSIATPTDPKSPDLKTLTTEVSLPFKQSADETVKMKIYTGPNDYDRLKAEKIGLEEVIPFGWSIFGLINRWFIRPIFLLLSSFIGSAGVVIMLLTLVVKLILYPLTYKMVLSQSKMGILKPEIEKLKAKYGDDAQAVQVEQMKMYREFGVNPLGGCLPMLLQMPIWLALYRFFPAALEFRQKGFLWADDLSSFDTIVSFGSNLPLIGDHISLLAVLWGVTTLMYTYYNSKDMDYSANPAMEYMQYLMPVIFVFFFNSFAAGLSLYLVFSNILNIAQTLITKNLVLNMDKIKAEMYHQRDNPKPKSAFQQRMEDAMKQQQAAAKKK